MLISLCALFYYFLSVEAGNIRWAVCDPLWWVNITSGLEIKGLKYIVFTIQLQQYTVWWLERVTSFIFIVFKLCNKYFVNKKIGNMKVLKKKISIWCRNFFFLFYCGCSKLNTLIRFCSLILHRTLSVSDQMHKPKYLLPISATKHTDTAFHILSSKVLNL